jgi:hypothetical protein
MKTKIAKYICAVLGHKWHGCICGRCGKTNSAREPHNWKLCHCTNCHALRHVWSDWEYVNHKSCLQQSNCERCTESKNMEHHNFTYQMKDSCIGTCTCSRCDKTEDIEDHSFMIESTEMYDVEHDMNNLVCTKCGFRTFEAWRVLPL